MLCLGKMELGTRIIFSRVLNCNFFFKHNFGLPESRFKSATPTL